MTAFDEDLKTLAADMVQTMHDARGIGLAAQQIGQAIRLCVVDLRETDQDFSWTLDGARPPLELFMPMVLVNPSVQPLKGTPSAASEEGCLSFPEIRGDVIRPEAIEVRYQDEHGIAHQLQCDGLFARCIQHEVDHLNGILFTSRMDKKTLASIDAAVTALAKATREARKASS